MAKKQLPAEPSEDSHCSFVYDEGPKQGQRCGAYHTSNSHLCAMHGEELASLHEARNRNAKRRKQLQEDLEYSHHDLQSLDGIAGFLEKVVNGVMAGFVKREKAGLVAMFVPTMYKIAKDRSGINSKQQPQMTGIQINIGNLDTNKLTASMTSEQLDNFLLGNEQVSVQVIEDMQKAGKLKVEKRKDEPQIIDVVAKESPIEPDKLKIPKGELAKITKETDLPLTAAQVEDLFGDCLGDTAGQRAGPMEQELLGFGALYEPGNLPVGMRPKRHDWNRRIVEVQPGFGKTIYTCKNCGHETNNTKNAGTCDGVTEDDFRNETVLRAEEEDGIDAGPLPLLADSDSPETNSPDTGLADDDPGDLFA